jgi:hypothetical protein
MKPAVLFWFGWLLIAGAISLEAGVAVSVAWVGFGFLLWAAKVVDAARDRRDVA